MVHSVLPESVPNAEWRPRRLFRSLQFDGIDDYGTFSNPLVDGSDWSIIALFRIKSFTERDIVDVVSNPATINGVTIYQSTKEIKVGVYQADLVPVRLTVSAAEVGKWYMVGMSVKDAQFFKGYLNGEYVSQKTLTNSTHFSNDVFNIGAGKPTDRLANVDITFILVYSRALSDSEIKHIYQNPYNPPLDGLVLWLSPASIDSVAGKWWDLSGNGNHGTIYGATVVEEEGEVTVQ
ncbi:MAG: LamG domain-containing protein [Candidatus Hydrothermae bacterium]|nr:LamG domain-containing protein [Candidatus Hydrothermae bacterium]